MGQEQEIISKAMSILGKRGGSVKSAKKTRAVRRNAKLGGRRKANSQTRQN